MSLKPNGDSISVFSPAKVNLFLRVLHRRPDGYHAIASLFQAISLGDTITLSLAEEDHFTCNEKTLLFDESNLIVKALHLFREQTGAKFNVRVHLKKKIPLNAGLGGGSSNAATMLFALNALTSSCIDEATLAKWSSTLGSDVPFFFSRGCAYCQGKGEEMREIAPLLPHSFWLAKPSEGLSTALVYRHFDPKTSWPKNPQKALDEALAGKIDLFNDLEKSAFFLMPSLSSLKNSLLDLGFSQVSMTGSGTSFICFEAEENKVDASCFPKEIQFLRTHFVHREAGTWYTIQS